MAKDLSWSQDSIALNKTLDDSLDLLFCQDLKKIKIFQKQMRMERSVRGLLKLIKDSL